MAQPLIVCAPAKLSAFWFGPDERIIATTIATVSQPLGVAIGYVFPSFFVSVEDSLPEFKDQARHAVYMSLLWQAIIGTVFTVFALIFFREKPATPPSLTAADTETVSILEGIKECFKNTNLLKLMFVFGMLLGIMNTLATATGIIGAQYGYTDDQASLFGALFIVGGIIGSGVAGAIVEIKKNYKNVLTAQAVLTTVTAIWLLFAMRSISVVDTSLACMVVGGVSLSSLPVGIDFAVEITHPIPESISSGLLMGTGQIVGVIFTVIVSLWITSSGNVGIIGG
jgi:Na+/melibiose symporter-like transporter